MWTDDAFINSRQFAVSTKVPGYIRDVDVTDNRKVAAGDVLVQIDDRDYRTSLAQSEARHSEAVPSVSNAEAQIAAQQAQVIAAEQQQTEAEAALQFVRQEFERAEKLVRTAAGTVQRSQQAQSQLLQAQATASRAKATVEAERSRLRRCRRRRRGQSQVSKGQRPTGRWHSSIFHTRPSWPPKQALL